MARRGLFRRSPVKNQQPQTLLALKRPCAEWMQESTVLSLTPSDDSWRLNTGAVLILQKEACAGRVDSKLPEGLGLLVLCRDTRMLKLAKTV